MTGSAGPPIISRSWLKALGLWPLYDGLKLYSVESSNGHKDDLKKILFKHRTFFEASKGSFTKGKIKLELKEGTTPKYMLARSVPFALKDKIEKELSRLVEEEIIVPVETSDWATPIVPVLKLNSDVRLCADFKVTVNPQLKTI